MLNISSDVASIFLGVMKPTLVQYYFFLQETGVLEVVVEGVEETGAEVVGEE